MKKVRILVGATGLAPAAIGLMVPNAPAAAAHTSANIPKMASKTVKLLHNNMTAAGTAATSTSSVVNNSPSPSYKNVGCRGVNKHTLKYSRRSYSVFKTVFWSGPLGNPVYSRCIGGVSGSWNDWNQVHSWNYRVRVYVNGTKKFSQETGLTCQGFDCSAHIGVHKYFHIPVEICAAWLPPSYSPRNNIYQCKTFTK
jgi:hypothetical protein